MRGIVFGIIAVLGLLAGSKPAGAIDAAPGLDLGFKYAGEWARALAGGLERRTIYHDNLDLTLTLDTERAGLWPGGRLFVHGLRNHGGDPSSALFGDLQVASNIEAPDQFIVHEAWLEQRAGPVSVLVGLHDMNSEFDVSEYASLFLNSSFGIGPEISANVPASLFPRAALGVRLLIEPAAGSSVRMAMYDGDPATRGFRSGEGRMWIGEIATTAEGMSARIGYWRHTAPKVFRGRSFSHDFGGYAVMDLRLGRWSGGDAGAFLQLGRAAPDRNEVVRYIGYGLHLSGLVPGRPNDELGLAVARAATMWGVERSIEATFRLQLANWLSLQPSHQWILHPGGDGRRPMVRAFLFRVEASI